ncbi:hypothetical protein ACFL35_10870 [Candidatus Riflebacteria bacterium]
MVKKVLAGLEKKLGHFAIPNLIVYIIMIQAGVYFYGASTNGRLFEVMLLDGRRVVYHLELWRLVTFILTPPFELHPFWLFFYLLLYLWIGLGLERHWGTFNFNFYYFFVVFLLAVNAVIFQQIAFVRALNNSLFIAFATVYPEMEILIYFVLPVKIKWLAYLQVFFDVVMFFTLHAYRISFLVAYGTYLLFFGEDFLKSFFYRKRRKEFGTRMEKAEQEMTDVNCCTICSASPYDSDEIELRYCTKCDPPVPYCQKHLAEHQHNK